jgi:clathrin heavy chain
LYLSGRNSDPSSLQSNKDAAREIYEKCGAKEKLTMIHAEEGNVDALVAATGGKPGEQPNYTYLLQNLLMSNPPGAVALAKAIIKQPGPPMDKATICNEFIQRQLYAEATSFALEALADDVPEEGPMQVCLGICHSLCSGCSPGEWHGSAWDL